MEGPTRDDISEKLIQLAEKYDFMEYNKYKSEYDALTVYIDNDCTDPIQLRIYNVLDGKFLVLIEDLIAGTLKCKYLEGIILSIRDFANINKPPFVWATYAKKHFIE